MTERFNAGADQTSYGASGVGPAETPSSLTALGVGQGSGQSANAQERNSAISFEFPIRWDDISSNLGRLTEKRPLEEVIDDLTVRDRELEDFLNTNIVNGIVAGSNITINRAAGIVTITGAAPAWTTFTPDVYNGANTAATVGNNNSAWMRMGSLVIVRINIKATWATNTYPTYITGMPVQLKAAVNSPYGLGSAEVGGVPALMVNSQTSAASRIDFNHNGTPAGTTAWGIGLTVTYEAA